MLPAMAALSSTSTWAEVTAAYDDNASYAEDASSTKAAAFITACRVLLRRLPKRSVHGGRGGEEIEMDTRLIAEELRDAKRWLGTQSSVVRQADFSSFRD